MAESGVVEYLVVFVLVAASLLIVRITRRITIEIIHAILRIRPHHPHTA